MSIRLSISASLCKSRSLDVKNVDKHFVFTVLLPKRHTVSHKITIKVATGLVT